MSLIERALAKRDPNSNANPGMQRMPGNDKTTGDSAIEKSTPAVFENGAIRGVTEKQRVKKPESKLESTPGLKPESVTEAKVSGSKTSRKSGSSSGRRVKRLKLKLRTVGAQDYVREGANRSELIGTFRHIKRPLLANVYGHGVPVVPNGKRIMVTSSLPGEGKTFTSIHLALSIAAEVDTSVILVDADIIRPSVHSALGIDLSPGVADWFKEDKKSIKELVSPTTVNGLKVVAAGQWKANSAEVLAGITMKKFFEELVTAYPNDIIVVDSPPLLPASEGATLAKNMGQVVLVVGAGATSQSQVDQSLEMLEGQQAISLVLNRSRNSSSYANYGY